VNVRRFEAGLRRRWQREDRIPAQRPASRPAQGRGADRGQLAGEIRLKEGPVRDPVALEARNDAFQRFQAARAAKNQVGRRLIGREESVAAGLDGRMSGLHGLLKKGQIAAYEDIDIRRFTCPTLRKPTIGHRILQLESVTV
jgi:hypothetical protein